MWIIGPIWPDYSSQKGGVLLVDNVISHAAEVEEFIQLIQQDSGFIMSTLPIELVYP